MNKSWLVLVNAFLLMAAAHATDTTTDLEKKLSPQEMEKIKKEAEKLKEGKKPAQPPATAEQEKQPEDQTAEKNKAEDEVRARSIKRRETMHQGFYPSKEVTQKPSDSLTEKTIRPLN